MARLPVSQSLAGLESGLQAMFDVGSAKWRLRVCTILQKLALHVDSKQEVVSEDVVAEILYAMEWHPRHIKLQQCACKALGILTDRGHSDFCSVIADHDGVDTILDAIDRYPNDKVIFNDGGSAALLAREAENAEKAEA